MPDVDGGVSKLLCHLYNRTPHNMPSAKFAQGLRKRHVKAFLDGLLSVGSSRLKRTGRRSQECCVGIADDVYRDTLQYMLQASFVVKSAQEGFSL